MEFVRILRDLWRLRRWVAVSSLLAFLIALSTGYRIGFFPPGLHPKSLQLGVAEARILVDTPHSSLVDLGFSYGPVATPAPGGHVRTNANTPAPVDLSVLSTRAKLFADLLRSPALKQRIGHAAGIRGSLIEASAPSTADVPITISEQDSAQRGNTLLSDTNSYRLTLLADPRLPVVTVSAQAPSVRAAVGMANGAVTGLQQYLSEAADREAIPASDRIAIVSLGPATGGLVNPGINAKVVVLAFIALFVIGCITVVRVSSVIRNWQAASDAEHRAGQPASERGSAHALRPLEDLRA